MKRYYLITDKIVPNLGKDTGKKREIIHTEKIEGVNKIRKEKFPETKIALILLI